MEKYVYFFGGGKADGNGTMKDVLGGKGAGLAEMTNAGLPVPPGFTIVTSACRLYFQTATRRPRISSPRRTRRWRNWKNCWAKSSATSRIPCWFRSAPAPSFPCRA